MRRYYCTYFDRNYLLKGLALIQSLNRVETSEFTLFVVCMDELTRTVLRKLDLPNIVTIPIHQLEQGDDALLKTKRERSVVEYLWTCTPTIILRTIEQNPEIELLTYLDSDLYFFSAPDPIFDELGDGSILIHQHRFPPTKKELEKWGKYNVGLLSFRRDAHGLGALNWWRERCIEWCYAEPDDGKYGDQVYLNDWPTRFQGVVDLANIGAGVAPWNHSQYRLTEPTPGEPRIDGKPVIFYHFHSFKAISFDCFLPLSHLEYHTSPELIRSVVLPYCAAHQDALRSAQSALASYNFGLSSEGALSAFHSFITSESLGDEIKKLELPQVPMQLDDKWVCFASQQVQTSEVLLRDSLGT